MTFDPQVLKDDIMIEAGAEFLPFEIADRGLNLAIKKTLELYSKHKPNLRHENYKTTTTVTFKELPEDVIGVQSVDMTRMGWGQGVQMNIEDAFLSGYPIFFGTGDGVVDVEYLTIRRMWIKQVQRSLAADPDYHYAQDPITGRWTVITYSSQNCYVDVMCVIPHTPDLKTIPYSERSWFRDYAMAEAKNFVGNVRNKYADVFIAGGKTQLNGNQLKQEAKAEKAELLEVLLASRTDLVPKWG